MSPFNLPKDLLDAVKKVLAGSEKKIQEVAIAPNEIASPATPMGQVGPRQGIEMPICVDVLKSSDNFNSEIGYRALISYPNKRPDFIPDIDSAPAKGLDELLSLCSGHPGYSETIEPALRNAFALPSDEPRFRGNDKK